MHIVVIGGNGFIGSHFVAAAIDRGHAITVVGRDRQPRFSHGRNFDFRTGGLAALARDPRLLAKADLVCHFASSTIPATSNADPIADIEGNLVGTVALLEAMRLSGNRRILYLSSGGAVYGRPQAIPISESHPLNPVSAYGVTKVAIENYLRMYEQIYAFRPTIVRPANPYGPGQRTVGQLGAVTTFLDLALAGGTATVWGDGSTVRDFVYISDLVALLLDAAENETTGTFNCGAGTGTSLHDLMALVESATGNTLNRITKPQRSFDPPAIVLDIAHAEKTFGWRPCVALAEGIELTLSDFLTAPPQG